MQKQKLDEMADYMINALLDRGFVIQRYDAYSTSSIYLKLDYGVSNSIRIGDHFGKKHLSYRYNIGPMYKKISKTDRPYTRHYFPVSRLNELIQLIEDDRNQKVKMYGAKRYAEYMEQNQEKGKTQPGFWRQARLVERRE